VAFLKAQSIEADEMELDSVKSEKEDVREPRTGEVRSTTLTSRQSILIGSWDANKIHRITGQIGQLIGKGVPLTVKQPAYTHTKLAEKRLVPDHLPELNGVQRKRLLRHPHNREGHHCGDGLDLQG
jgi:hypothetical protein